MAHSPETMFFSGMVAPRALRHYCLGAASGHDVPRFMQLVLADECRMVRQRVAPLFSSSRTCDGFGRCGGTRVDERSNGGTLAFNNICGRSGLGLNIQYMSRI